jgi:NAD-dependent deacetylase
MDYILNDPGVPRCPACGGRVKPDVVLYEEGLDPRTMEEPRAAGTSPSADMLIIGGTSLNVYPAAGLIRYYSGHKLVLINKSAVARDLDADLVITDPIGQTLSQI